MYIICPHIIHVLLRNILSLSSSDNLHNYLADILISGLQNAENPGASSGQRHCAPPPPHGPCPCTPLGTRTPCTPALYPGYFQVFFSKSILIPQCNFKDLLLSIYCNNTVLLKYILNLLKFYCS